MAALNIENVWKKYGNVIALRDVNLDIRDGEFVVLVGPSGCGKSTLLSIIAGLEDTSHGTLTLGEIDVTDLSPKDRNIALVFQSYALYPTMTVRQNITFGMENRKVPKAEQDKAVADVAKLLQIEPLLDRKPGQLSGGQRQRVAMGRALVRDPQLFLFDEPLSNLDAKLRVEMRTEMKKLHKRLGQTIVYVTHDQVEAMTLSDRIVVINDGVVQQFADPDTIYQKPANMFVAGFMGSPSMNFIDVEVTGRARAITAVHRGDGADIDFPFGATREELAPYIGKTITLGVRPEHFRPAGEAGLTLTVNVDVVEPTGPDTMVVFSVAGKSLVGVLNAKFRPEEDDDVTLSLSLDEACFFDTEGVRIRGLAE
ncbi:ABC transporter ATP-binding protein [Pelagimonas varians]|uniref:Maltose/maltodextrin import ATP-binding protein MalK n=1 Tax=Pelagimonas varians TaxID=696760 RepID=A0A238L126_9RHOB|nr:ABC transporter ATP-binding protein [Pelagimonas varians]PYG27221.1 carbohydrate ABC transporter ATP-binding protein (CUT1 family) [Pelagimonas varians]SMX48697.1 Maltose/maltodextrin import ATP-binding protein MalK [Pelagimonas varians]